MFLILTDPDDLSAVVVNFNQILQFYKSKFNAVTVLVPAKGESIYVQEPVDYILKQLEALK